MRVLRTRLIFRIRDTNHVSCSRNLKIMKSLNLTELALYWNPQNCATKCIIFLSGSRDLIDMMAADILEPTIMIHTMCGP